ncbi:hypothetical protein BD626DRAFT_495781 [Schizophyllum amplum]|uniref:Uncharacterized protein n=1 Tax=Schizophyllum amplum TaxID=97359 RepID=A0A550CEG1_9AGAR|nr:hypothetical protein BD626DRAFT_495781 [Auriculariopsis ampla]
MRPTTALLWCALCLRASATMLEPMEQSWVFDFYTEDGDLRQFPVYEQCETMRIKWNRGSATGPSGTAPYSFLIYTSIYQFPFVLDVGSSNEYDFEVPFPPNTQFDANGYTGGCQSVVNVVHNTTAFSRSCSNDTLSWPDGPLDIEAYDVSGPLSWTGWPPQCTDLQLTPKNGTAPYTVTVAPPSHPPYNATIDDMSTFNWTVGLSWSTPFYVSVADSDHNLWSIGMLHSGEGKASCLGGDDPSVVSPAAAVGAGIGGLVLGLIVGALGVWFFLRRRRSRRPFSSAHEPFAVEPPSPSSPYAPYDPHAQTPYAAQMPFPREPSSPFHREPSSPTTQAGSALLPQAGSALLDPLRRTEGSSSDGGMRESAHNVYVVHHDGGAVPVTVYHGDDTRVVELPPRYAGSEDDGERGLRDGERGARDGERNSGDGAGESEPFDPYREESRDEGFSPQLLIDQRRRPTGARKPHRR